MWPDSDIGTTYTLSPCVQRYCGGTYSTGGQWEPVVITCATDYVTCAVDELESLQDEALNNTEVCTYRASDNSFTLLKHFHEGG